MAKGRKSTDDFMIRIGDGDKPKLRRSSLTDEKTIDEAVDQVATTGAPKARKTVAAKIATSKKPKAPASRTPEIKSQPKDGPELEEQLRNKRLTIDIPFYLHDALREYNFLNRTTTKDIINDYLHGLLKQKDIRTKK